MKNELPQPSLEFMDENPLEDSHGSIEVREIVAEGTHEPITEANLRAAIANLTNRTVVKEAGKICAEKGAKPGEYLFGFWDDVSQLDLSLTHANVARFMPKDFLFTVFDDAVQKQCNELINPKAANPEVIPYLGKIDGSTQDDEDEVVGRDKDGAPLYQGYTRRGQ